MPAPAAPPRPDVTVDSVKRPCLAWPATPDTTAWQICDRNNRAKLVQATVTEPHSIRSPMRPGQRREYGLIAVGPGGTSPMSPTVVVSCDHAGNVTVTSSAPTPTPSPAPVCAQHPYDVLGGAWYLTLPTGKPGHPDTVQMPALKTYSSDFFRLNDAGDGVVFTANAGGVTTKTSHYPRSELRQCNPDGSLADWSNTGVGQALTVRQAITKVPPAKPEVVGAQIHDGRSDVLECLTMGGKLVARYADDRQIAVLDPAYVLGTPYDLQIVAAHGLIHVAYDGVQKLTVPIAGSGWYLKLGAYVQSNASHGDKPDALGEVVVYSAHVDPAA